MIRSLRIRFIRTAMLAVTVVLFLLIGTIDLLNYRSVIQDAEAVLTVLAENDGAFPDMAPGGDAPRHDGPPPAQTADSRDPWRDRRALTVETPFESRYFSVTLDADGQVTSCDMSRIAAIDEDEAAELAGTVLISGRTSGFCGRYRYRKATGNGSTTIFFLDCQRSLSDAQAFLLASVLVSLLGLAGVLLLVILLSGRVVRPVQESYEKQKRFITDAGHELKTPLTIIDADISVAEMESGASEWLDDIRTQTKRLSGLTNDLIYLSRMDEGASNLQPVDFLLSDAVTDAARSFRSRIQLEGKTLETHIDPTIGCHGDEPSLTRLVTILLDNAVKYSSDRGTISVSLKQKGKFRELIVENDTDTVDPDMLAHLFDRFYRADASRSSERGGYGIGLSIAQAVVAAHKGTIAASSPDGKRLRITVDLP